MSCFVQYAPYHLKEGGWDEHREAFGDTVVNTIAEHAPNLKDLILHRQVLTPLDIEREFGLTEGNIFQGELDARAVVLPAARAGLGAGTGHRSRTCTCADRRPTRAVASWGRPVATPRS